jgi:hypothetical protein
MEIFLNCFWVLIALAGVIAWRTRWTRQTRLRRHAAWREWSAFVCAMVLLFFVVSLTDDLHADSLLLEECSTSRRHAICVVCARHSSPPGGGAPHAWATLQGGPGVESLVFGGLILPSLENRELQFSVKRAADRAPPASVH